MGNKRYDKTFTAEQELANLVNALLVDNRQELYDRAERVRKSGK